MKSKTSLMKNNKQEQSCIVEYQVQSSGMICSDKSQCSNQSTQKQKLLKILDLDSTSREKDFKPYWNLFCQEVSAELWLPTMTDSQDSGSIFSSSSLNKQAGNSWFSINQTTNPLKKSSQKTCLPFYTTSPVKCTEGEVIRAKKIKIKPNTKQKQILQSWFGTSRLVYNASVEYLNLPKEQKDKGGWMSFATNYLNKLKVDKPSTLEVPFQIKKIAVEDAFKAFSNGIKKCKKTGEPFKLKFRSKKNPVQSCYIPKSALNSKGIYPRVLSELKLTESFPEEPMDSRLIMENNQFYICVPYKQSISLSENQGRCVALDPGIRTFVTGFSETETFKIASGDFARIARLCSYIDLLISKKSKAKAKQKHRLNRALMKLRAKHKSLIDELHYKTINFLVKNYDIILLPTFETGSMVQKKNRKLQSKTARMMLSFSFYKFSQRLESAAKRYNRLVVRCSEAFTSKTASWTGEIVNIGSKKIISSNNVTVDRDINGARGIFLRALVDNPSLQYCSVHS